VCEEHYQGNCFNRNVPWKIGRGSKVKFWEDVWLKVVPLKNAFPRLYGISLDKEITIGEVVSCYEQT